MFIMQEEVLHGRSFNMDFKSLRSDKLKLTQEEFANIYGISILEVQELDKTGKPDMDLIVKIANKSGLDFNTILSYEKPRVKPINTKYTWEKTDFTKKTLSEYLNSALEQMDIPDFMRKNYLDDLDIGIMSKFAKPTVAIVGRSDTGKSTLINSLIDAEKMPAKWTPTTSTAVYVKHIKERPDFIHDEAWIFKRECENEKFWNSKRLYDEEYCKKWKVAGGDLSLLETYSTRQGGGLKTEAGSAVVFVDAPILLNCDIIDLPGYGTETASDDIITAKTAAQADVLIYLSLASGFLRIEDIEYLKNNVRTLPILEKKGENGLKPLANLFVVASHADSVDNGNELSLANILKSGCDRFISTLSDEYRKERSKKSGYNYDSDVIQSCFFTYTTDIPVLCEKFRNSLEAVLETIPGIIDKDCREAIQAYVARKEPNLEAEIQKYESLRETRLKWVELLESIRNSELERSAQNDREKREIKDFIHLLNRDSINECTNYCASMLSVDQIAYKIKSKGIKNKKEDIQQFASQLQDEMQTKCSDLLKEKSEELSTKVKEYVSEYQENVQASFQEASLDADFDAGYAFASSLAKIGIIGGLGAFLAADAAFAFGSWAFLFGIGGQIALFANFLGPIGIVAGTLISAALGVMKIFNGGWEKNVAKKLVSAFEEKGVSGRYREAISKYWNQTEMAFDKAAEQLDQAWNVYVKQLENTVDSYDIEQIEASIAAAKEIQSFFENIPL